MSWAFEFRLKDWACFECQMITGWTSWWKPSLQISSCQLPSRLRKHSRNLLCQSFWPACNSCGSHIGWDVWRVALSKWRPVICTWCRTTVFQLLPWWFWSQRVWRRLPPMAGIGHQVRGWFQIWCQRLVPSERGIRGGFGGAWRWPDRAW